jgi:protein-disulfide isomerase
MNNKKIILLLFILVTCLLQTVNTCYADVEWNIKKQLSLDVAPIDVASSSNGQWIYVLASGEILVYSVSEDKVVNRIPVDKSFDRIAHSALDNTLIVMSSSGKTLKLIQLDIVYKFDLAGLSFKGLEKAPVTIAVFSDYQWPYCARLEPELQQLLEKNPKDVKLVFKNFPLPMHQFAKKASIAALAANRQGKFWEYHHKLFEAGSSLSEAKIQDIAKELGLDLEKFNKDLKDPAIENLINRDTKDGVQADVKGTPTIFVNGKLLKNRSIEGFQQMIDAELNKRKWAIA